MTRVVAPASTPSVAAIDASVESRKLAPSMAPAARLAPSLFRTAAAPQAQAATLASMAPRQT